mmetsp:Transcript_21284/g.31600  ORF Transcript_21284/g.31600 Transcript_21284/m.31600 type:complete len:95 (+) Transcript_21284:527-811(+)
MLIRLYMYLYVLLGLVFLYESLSASGFFNVMANSIVGRSSLKWVLTFYFCNEGTGVVIFDMIQSPQQCFSLLFSLLLFFCLSGIPWLFSFHSLL